MRLRMSAPIVAVALLSGCPQSSPPPHASGGPGTANTAPVHTRAVAPAMPVESKAPADSPYVDMKKGQVWIVKKASHVVAGGDVIDRWQIRSVTDKYVDATYSTDVPKMPKYNQQPQQKVLMYDAKLAPGTGPPADAKPIASETITVSNIEFPCEVYEETQRNGQVRRVWFSKKFPWRIRVVDATGATMEELREVQQSNP